MEPIAIKCLEILHDGRDINWFFFFFFKKQCHAALVQILY